MGVQVMPADNGLQVGEVVNNCDLVTAEGQVDKVLDRGYVSGCRDGFELDALVIVKALQPFGQIVNSSRLTMPPSSRFRTKYPPLISSIRQSRPEGSPKSNARSSSSVWGYASPVKGKGTVTWPCSGCCGLLSTARNISVFLFCIDFSHARPQTFLFVTPADKSMGWIGTVLAQVQAGTNWVWQGFCQGFRGVQLVGTVLEQGHLGRKKGGAFSGAAI